MTQDPATSEANYATFIANALANEKVYGLQDRDGGWAVCSSQQKQDTDVVLFWSDRAHAARQAKAEWANYKVSEIGLEEFVGAWLRGMHQDGSLVGPNWDVELSGLEVEAVEVAKRLTEDVASDEA